MAYHLPMGNMKDFGGYTDIVNQHTYGSQSMSNHWGQPIGHGHPPAQGIVSLEAPGPACTWYHNQNTLLAGRHESTPAFAKPEHTSNDNNQNNFNPGTHVPIPEVATSTAIPNTIPPSPAAPPDAKATARKALIFIETVYHRFAEAPALRDTFDGHCLAYKNGVTTEAEFYMALYRMLYFNNAANLIPMLKTLMPQSWKEGNVEWFDRAIEEDVEMVGGLRSLRVKLVVAKKGRKGKQARKNERLVLKLPNRSLRKRTVG